MCFNTKDYLAERVTTEEMKIAGSDGIRRGAKFFRASYRKVREFAKVGGYDLKSDYVVCM